MIGVRAKVAAELKALVEEGLKMLRDFTKPQGAEQSLALVDYQQWYTRTLAAVRALLPDRLDEFVQLYRPARKSDKGITMLSFGINDYLLGVRIQRHVYGGTQDAFSHENTVAKKMLQQVQILGSAQTRLNDILPNLRGVLQAELFDTELDAAKELLKTGHLRAAGAVAGVVLERHLASVATAHDVTVRKKNPSASDWNDALKEAGVVEIPVWRNVQRLSDLRNVCAHDKKREPTADEVRELIDGADKLTKTLA